MKTNFLPCLMAVVLLIIPAVAAGGQGPGVVPVGDVRVSGGLSTGYDAGLPIQGHIMIENIAEGLPLAFRFMVGSSLMLDPGNPDAARRVFINENTNGVPQKSATRWVFGFDLMHKTSILSLNRAYFFGGVRYSRFTGTFDFIGGNEFFDVHANQMGLAAGIESYFRMSPRVDLFFSVGGEYYFPATLEGHDAAYSPDGTTVNQRENFTYSDASSAINQPKFQPRLLIGIGYGF
jgi:hypothetical protein